MITNTSLLWRKDVRRDLMGADWVSLKVDAVEEEDWRRVGRPHGSLKLASILEGALEFPKVCDGNLATETMLLEGVNDSAAFAFTGNVEDDLLSITAVHPMREDAVREFLAQAMADWSVVDRLIARGQIVELEYQEQRFYMRRLSKGNGR